MCFKPNCTVTELGGVRPEDLGGGVQCASGNPYPISDQQQQQQQQQQVLFA